MMRRFTLTQRLGALIAVLLLAMAAASVALQLRASLRHAQETIQRLSLDLARQIGESNASLLAPEGLDPRAVHDLFDKLMAVNPSVELYLLDPQGRIVGHAAPECYLRRDRVGLAPLRALLAGAALPVFGDDPRSLEASKVFSVAPLRAGGAERGFIYVVLVGENHDAVAQAFARDEWLTAALSSMALVALLALAAAWLALRWITRPLRQLTLEIQRFEAAGHTAAQATDQATEPALLAPAPAGGAASRDEITQLRQAFAQMSQRLARQWQELASQDQQRRELVANISHDLRTPLTSLHGYLETLRLKAHLLSPDDQRRYLDIALGQSRKVGALAQSLFELARLEHGGVKPEKELFSLGELVQDVFQKFELAAEARQLRLVADFSPGLPGVKADLGMIERVLTNLLDNAVRHTPPGGEIVVQLRPADAAIEVRIADSGPGIPSALQPTLFTRPALRNGWRGGTEVNGGLGLLIVRRILQLHDSDIRLEPTPEAGAVFRFRLQAA